MSAEELAASASTSANMNYAEVQIERVQYQSVCTIFYQMAIAAGKMNADEVFPNVAAVSNTGMASANPSNYAEVQIIHIIMIYITEVTSTTSLSLVHRIVLQFLCWYIL